MQAILIILIALAILNCILVLILKAKPNALNQELSTKFELIEKSLQKIESNLKENLKINGFESLAWRSSLFFNIVIFTFKRLSDFHVFTFFSFNCIKNKLKRSLNVFFSHRRPINHKTSASFSAL